LDLRQTVALLTLIVFFLDGPLRLRAGEPSARDMYKRGRKYEKAKDFANAYIMYSQAAAKDPGTKEYWQRAQALQRRAVSAANVMPSGSGLPLMPAPPPLDPLNAAAAEEVREATAPQPPVELQAQPAKKDFDINADSKAVWEQVTKAYGLEVIFDGDYQAGQPIRFRLSDAEYREALHALMTATGSFIVPISEKLLLVVKDTEQKRREVENTVAFSVPIPEPFSVQEAQELGRSVQQVMEIQRFAIDSAQRLAIFRDRVSKALPARMLFTELLHARAQVIVDIELLSMAKTSSRALGLTLPTSFSLTSLVQTMALGSGLPPFALSTLSATVLARETKAEARTLFQAQLRSMDGQAAQLHVGEKYPIMTVAYIGNTFGSDNVSVPPPTFNFEDLGLNVKLTPKVHDRNEVSIEIDAEFKILAGGSLNGIPIVSNRKFVTRVRLRFDEAAVISGLVTRNDLVTLSGPAGLVNIPFIGPALGQTNWTKDDVQLLVVLKPRLLSTPPTELVTREIWVGSESRPRIPM
jgi:general secretion pathway protein D